jgi:hypothetical protein
MGLTGKAVGNIAVEVLINIVLPHVDCTLSRRQSHPGLRNDRVLGGLEYLVPKLHQAPWRGGDRR